MSSLCSNQNLSPPQRKKLYQLLLNTAPSEITDEIFSLRAEKNRLTTEFSRAQLAFHNASARATGLSKLVDNTQARVWELQDEFSEARSESADSLTEDLTTELADSHARFSDLQNQLARERHERKACQYSLGQTQATLNITKMRMEELYTENAKMKVTVSNLKVEMKDLELLTAEAQDISKMEKNEMYAQISELSELAARHEHEKKELQAQLAKYQEGMALQHSEYKDLSRQYEHKAKECLDVRTFADKLERRIGIQEEANKYFVAESFDTANKAMIFEKTHNAKSEKIAELVGELEQQKSFHLEAVEKLVSDHKRIVGLVKSASAAEEAKLAKENVRLERENDQLEDQLTAQCKDTATLAAELRKLNDRVVTKEDHEAIISIFQQKYREKDGALLKAGKELYRAQDKKAQLEKHITALHERHNSMRKDYAENREVLEVYQAAAEQWKEKADQLKEDFNLEYERRDAIETSYYEVYEEHEQLKRDYQNECFHVAHDRDCARSSLDLVQKELEDTKAMKDEVHRELAETTAKIHELSKSQKEAVEKHDMLQEVHNHALREYADLSVEVSDLMLIKNKELNDLNKHFNAVQSCQNKTIADLNEMKLKTHSERVAVVNLKQELKDLRDKTAVEKIEQEAVMSDALSKKEKEANTKLELLRMTAADEMVKKLELQKTESDTHLKSMDKQISDLAGTLRTKNQQLERADFDKHALTKSLAKAAKQIVHEKTGKENLIKAATHQLQLQLNSARGAQDVALQEFRKKEKERQVLGDDLKEVKQDMELLRKEIVAQRQRMAGEHEEALEALQAQHKRAIELYDGKLRLVQGANRVLRKEAEIAGDLGVEALD